MKEGGAMGFAWTLKDFLRFGVPRFVGGNSSTGIIEPSGLTTWETAELPTSSRRLMIDLA